MLEASHGPRPVYDGTPDVGKIRVFLLQDDPAVRCRLEVVIAEDPAYVVVGSADSWGECEPLLDEHMPDIFIAEGALLPPNVSFEPSDLPLVLQMQFNGDSDQASVDRSSQEFRERLFEVRQQLYSRKACEISRLLDHYLAGLDRFSYLSTLKVSHDRENIELPVPEIRMIEASGNYVRIYATHIVYVLREAISSIQARLDPRIFLRVHRSYIVNARFISHLSPGDNGASVLVLTEGNTIPIGPNYRDEVRRLLKADEELIA